MDVRGVTYADVEELELYCRRVAGSIGRLCLAIFGTHASRARGRASDQRERPASELADDLGVALQLANILRDMREDAETRPRVPGGARHGALPPARRRPPRCARAAGARTRGEHGRAGDGGGL